MGESYVPRNEAFDRLAQQPAFFWLGILTGALMIIGTLGTWATALGIVSISGTRGDGWLVVAAAVVGLAALWSRVLRESAGSAVLAMLCGVAGAQSRQVL